MGTIDLTGTTQRTSGARSRALTIAWIALGATLLAIVMGAVVRGTLSGDGCGASWPGCDGAIIPGSSDDTAQLIEFSHRVISGVSLLVTIGLVWAVFRAFRAPHPARTAALYSLGFLVAEALIGAVIVLYGWVAHDRSAARQVSVPLHVVNTFLLTASMALTIWLIAGRPAPRLRGQRHLLTRVAGLAGLMLLVAATGATTSIADTLFGADSVREGIQQDLSSESALIVRLRVLHPFVAVTTGVLVVLFARAHLDEAEHRGLALPAWMLIFGVAGQAVLGVVHIALLTPLATALVHLAVAQVLWLALVFLAITLLSPAPEREPSEA